MTFPRSGTGLDHRAGLCGVDHVGPQDITVVVLRPDRLASKPYRLLAKEIRATEVAIAVQPVIAFEH